MYFLKNYSKYFSINLTHEVKQFFWLLLTFSISKKLKLSFQVISGVTAHVCTGRKFGRRWAGLVKHLLSGWNVEARPDCADPGASVGGSSVLISSYSHRDRRLLGS